MKLKFTAFLAITLSIVACQKDNESLLTKTNETLNETEVNTTIQDSILNLDNNSLKSVQNSGRGWDLRSNKQA